MANKNKISLILLCLFLAIQAVSFQEAHAFKFSAKICKKYNLGSNWYCEEEKKKEKTLTTPNEIMARDILPEQKAVLLNQLWDTQQKRAVITGKKEDLENVLITQRYITKLGTDFGKKMMRLTETVPEYSKSESYYQQISDEFIKSAQETEVLKRAKERYALAFVYASGCPYCERQLPILHSLKESIGITLLGVSVDGAIYKGLDLVITDKEVTKDPNVRAFPTIMLVDSKTNKRLFIAKGLTTKDRLAKLIYKKILEVENA
jgi:conjugal transfer pilus assembly protein TraF